MSLNLMLCSIMKYLALTSIPIQLSDELLRELLRGKRDECIRTVAILGPQSSGKSTSFNTLIFKADQYLTQFQRYFIERSFRD
jgi:Fe-S cluster assembly ATPase SufC